MRNTRAKHYHIRAETGTLALIRFPPKLEGELCRKPKPISKFKSLQNMLENFLLLLNKPAPILLVADILRRGEAS